MPTQAPQEVASPAGGIYAALLKVAEATGLIIKKFRPELGYTIAGAAQVIQEVRPRLLENGILVFPVKCQFNRSEYETKGGKAMNRAIVDMEWRFLHVPSGTYIDIPSPGEGNDVGDKSIQKARTISQKYALRQALMLEFGDADPDNDPSESQERARPASKPANPPAQSHKTAQVTDEAKKPAPRVDEGTEMATEEAWSYWLDLVEQAKALKIITPSLEFPLPISVLRQHYKETDAKIKKAKPTEE